MLEAALEDLIYWRDVECTRVQYIEETKEVFERKAHCGLHIISPTL